MADHDSAPALPGSSKALAPGRRETDGRIWTERTRSELNAGSGFAIVLTELYDVGAECRDPPRRPRRARRGRDATGSGMDPRGRAATHSNGSRKKEGDSVARIALSGRTLVRSGSVDPSSRSFTAPHPVVARYVTTTVTAFVWAPLCELAGSRRLAPQRGTWLFAESSASTSRVAMHRVRARRARVRADLPRRPLFEVTGESLARHRPVSGIPCRSTGTVERVPSRRR